MQEGLFVAARLNLFNDFLEKVYTTIPFSYEV
ncbi:MAG: hypothetical protein RUMPE_00583 [Eubacteriales bacterium SKADARSKE-1]|nr:hypothetical protein [Eubacteriales bacterium SKADARSKE-1]